VGDGSLAPVAPDTTPRAPTRLLLVAGFLALAAVLLWPVLRARRPSRR
jgi:hypothetical protein